MITLSNIIVKTKSQIINKFEKTYRSFEEKSRKLRISKENVACSVNLNFRLQRRAFTEQRISNYTERMVEFFTEQPSSKCG
jgi:hypothetical protein